MQMYTVILYLNKDDCLIDKYKFIFFSLQEDNQIYLYPYQQNTTAKEIVNKLNELTQSCQAWKLIIFAGSGYQIKSNFEKDIPEEIRKLIRLYTGRKTDGLPRVDGYFPDQLYCVVCGKKPIAQGQASQLFTADNTREFGGSFRMLWFALDTSCKKNELFDWFRLDCILLILAVNQIPPGCLEYGYLYRLDIDIDTDLFSRYVLEQEVYLKKVGQYLETVSDSLQILHKTGNGYIEDTDFKNTLDECRKSIRNPHVIQVLRRGDLRHQTLMYGKLEANRREIHARINFPKGLLRDEAARIQDMVEKRPGIEEFLSAAGKDMLERREWEKLEEICKKKRVRLKQTEYEREYEEREEDVWRCTQKKMKRSVKVIACLLLSLLECFMLMPFLHYSINHVSENNLLYRIMQCVGVDRRLPWKGEAILLTGGIVWGGCVIIVGLAVLVCSFIKETCVICMYHKHVNKGIEKRQEQRLKYYEEVVNLLAEYQYCIRLLREQEEREQEWEEKMRGVQSHRYAWKQNSAVCRQLKFFTGQDEESVDVPITFFDVQEDPKQIEYYWMPFKESQGKAELNRSGFYVRGIFVFVTGIHIVKTLMRPKLYVEEEGK